MIVEVLDSGTVEYDRGYKSQLYGRHGVREYWMVDPDAETIDVLGEGDDGLVTLISFGNSGERGYKACGNDDSVDGRFTLGPA